MRRPRRTNASREGARSGYVLVMALAMIALAGFLLAGVARQSLSAALNASEAREDLQRRWGAASCRQAFLDHAPEIFAVADAADVDGTFASPDTTRKRISLDLGMFRFELLLADESSKANVNTAYSSKGKETAVSAFCLRQADAADGLTLALRPFEHTEGRAFQSWGQVFALGTSQESASDQAELADSSRLLTCWGDGRLNVRRTADDTLFAVARLVLSGNTASQLVAVRRQNPRSTMRQWLDALTLDRRDRQRLDRLLCEESTCYSLSITASSDSIQWSAILVAEQGDRGQTRVSRFVW